MSIDDVLVGCRLDDRLVPGGAPLSAAADGFVPTRRPKALRVFGDVDEIVNGVVEWDLSNPVFGQELQIFFQRHFSP
jgi:hypothetical protein